MKTMFVRSWVYALLCSLTAFVSAQAQETATAPPSDAQVEQLEAPKQPSPAAEPALDVESDAPHAPEPDEQHDFDWDSGGDNSIVRIGGDATLAAGEQADAVVSIFGSSSSAGEVSDGVVSIFGDTRVTGPTQDAVAVFGNTYIDSHVRGSAVAVFGNLTLGPNAEVDGEAVVFGGALTKDPQARVYGPVNETYFDSSFLRLDWMRPWVKHAMLYGRPLAFEPDLGWAWTLAFGFLALYVLFALMFGETIEKCAEVMENHPGRSILAAFVSVVLTPVVFIILTISIIGILLVPFLGLALFCIGLFGKAVMLAVLGRRLTRFIDSPLFGHVAFTVLIGGLLAMLLYTIPVLGFITYKVLGILGIGVVLYAMLLAMRARQIQPAIAAGANGGAMGDAATVPNADATPSGAAPSVEPTSTSAVPPVPSAALPRAGFWIRMVALLIDVILVSIISNVLFDSAEGLLVVIAAYGALMWKLRGTTVGGIICNIHVVRLDGREVDWATAVVRALGCFLSLALAGLGFIWIAFDPDRQAWHDKIAGTVVVQVPKGKSLV